MKLYFLMTRIDGALGMNLLETEEDRAAVLRHQETFCKPDLAVYVDLEAKNPLEEEVLCHIFDNPALICLLTQAIHRGYDASQRQIYPSAYVQ